MLHTVISRQHLSVHKLGDSDRQRQLSRLNRLLTTDIHYILNWLAACLHLFIYGTAGLGRLNQSETLAENYMASQLLGYFRLRYFGRYPAMGSARYHWDAWR